MSDWSRQAIDVTNESKTLYLKEKDSGTDSELRLFTILKAVGHGNSAYVYEAEYLSGGVSHKCILKELFPKECGLRRNERDGVTLCFAEQSNSLKTAEYKERYETIRRRYLNAYRIQNNFRNADHPKLNNLEDKMLLAVGVSAPIGLYENKHGILYSVYECSSGISYDNEEYKERSLWEVLSVIIQTGNVISTFHRAGYVVLDIKEPNILITGNKDHRTAIQFDFDSLVKLDDLKNYSYSSDRNTSLLFTASDDLLQMPKELKSIRIDFEKEEWESAEGKIRTVLGALGERTDIFLLAAVLFRRLFGELPLKKMRKNNWEISGDTSKYITMPSICDKLSAILSKALDADIDGRYEKMETFLGDLRDLQSLSLLENNENKNIFKQSGLIWTETEVTEGQLRYCSRKHWEELSGEHGKFAQLVKFAGRFSSKVSLEDEQKNQIMPKEAFEHNNRVLLTGDGGMGKSTAVFDYWTEQLAKTPDSGRMCFYIDLSRFSAIRRISQNDSLINGQSAQNLPIELLTYIEINILQSFSITPKAARQNDALQDPSMFKQMTALHSLLSQESNNPHFMVILDGYNEILDKTDKAVFENALSKALNMWNNAVFVVTSRALADSSKDSYDKEKTDEKNVFNRFKKFIFVGIPDTEIEKAIQDNKGSERKPIAALKKDRIWEILKIPMFLNMYLSLHSEDTRSIHTRGELLDRFILNHEPETSERISLATNLNNAAHTGLRKFLVQYSLPFAANDMDVQRDFFSDRNLFFSKATVGNILYLAKSAGNHKISVYENCIENKVDPSAFGFNKKDYIDYTVKADMSESDSMELFFSKDIMENIISNEAGYCYKTTDGKISFIHQYYRDYFAAKHIQNILGAAEALGKAGLSREEQLEFIKSNGLDYTWSDDVCILLGEIIGDYKNEPGYKEE